MRKKIYRIVCIVLFTGLFMGCKDKVTPGVHEVKREQVSGVTLAVISPTEVSEYFEATGTVRAKTSSIIASRMMGTVTSLKVNEGDRVSAGQLLLTIDDRDVVQRVKAAEKGLEGARQHQSLAEITYQRYKKLYDEQALSGQELDQIETEKKVADSEYERAQAMLAEASIYHGFTNIVSSAGGVVTEKKIELGSMAVPGMPLITVEDDTAYRLEVYADEKLTGRVKRGMDVSVFIESLNRELPGKVTEVVPSIDPVSRSFLVKISLSDKDLKSGLYARVSIPVGKKEALLLPKKAVVEKGQLTGVFTVDTSLITYRLVRVGKRYNDRVAILSGLNPGESVIVDGVEKAVDGGVVTGQDSATVSHH